MIKSTYNLFIFQPLLQLLSPLGFLSNSFCWTNLLLALFLVYNSNACITKLDLVIKKRKLLKTFLYLFFHLLKFLSLFFSITIF